MLLAAPAARAAVDFYWTGNGNDGLWSTAANWATDDQGTPATEAPKKGDNANYYFDVPAGGLTVSVDGGTGIRATKLVVTTLAAAAELTITSPAQGKEFDFESGGTITVGDGATLVLNTDMGATWKTSNLAKDGLGTLVFDLAFRSPQTSRPLTIKDGTVVVRSTSKNPRFFVRMAGVEGTSPVFDNQLANGLYSHLNAQGLGGIRLNGGKLLVGDDSSNSNATNTIPPVLDTGTLAYGNERVATILEESPAYDLELNRADVLVSDTDPPLVYWTFDDASDPKKDSRGQGGRFITYGTPSVVSDPERGNVLSLDGNSGFRGPDASTWLSGFDPKNGFTFAFWLKPDASAVPRAKILWWGTMNNGKCAALRLHDGTQGNLFFNINSSGSDPCYFPVSTLRNGGWHHVAVAFDSTLNKFLYYYDGSLVKEAVFGGTYDPSKQGLYIGNIDGSPWGTGNGYKGLMDDFLLAARPLSAAEIAGVQGQGAASFASAVNLKALVANSSGMLSVQKPNASLKTLSGTALAGGVEMAVPGSTLTVGTDAGEASTTFQGTVSGEGATLVKTGADYALTLSGATKGVSNVVVEAGSLTLSRPLAATAAEIPAPVARWTFDGENPLLDSTGNPALTLSPASSNGTFNVEFVSGDAICGKAAKFNYKTGNGSLRLATFPTGIIPAGSSAFTAIARYRPDTSQVNDGAMSAFGWGTAGGYTSGQLFRIGPAAGNSESARCVIRNSGLAADGSYRTALGNDRTRWYTVAVVYTAGNIKLYMDGTLARNTRTQYNITADMFAIGTSWTGNKAYSGLIDDVQIYNSALTDAQVRMIAEQLEASKGRAATDAAVPEGVLGDTPGVTVAQGATLNVASVESIGNLSGAGAVDIAPQARLNLAGTRGFTGTVSGDGAAGIADNAILDFGDGTVPLIVLDHPLELGTNVTVRTTGRNSRFRLASAPSFTGSENIESWTVADIGDRPYRFMVTKDGKNLDLSLISSMLVIFR